MDKELKDTLIALTENLVATTQTAFRATEMATGVYGFISSRHPNIKEEYEKTIRGAEKLHAERDRQLQALNGLLEKLSGL